MNRIFIIILCFLSFSLKAQQDIGLHFMDGLWQSNLTNPAYFTDHKVDIGVTSFYNNIVFNGFTLSDAFIDQNGTQVLDIDAAIAEMDDINSIQESFEFQTLNIGFAFNKLHFSLSHSIKFDGTFEYTKTFPQIAFQGNAQFVGQNVEVAPRFDLLAYNEFALGAGYKTEKFSIGGRAKFLSGAGSIVTNSERRSAKIYTDPDIYQLTVVADYEVQAASFLTFNDFNDYSFDFGADNLTQNIISKNSGMAFDLGASVDFDNLHLAASILDIGSIEWTDNTHIFSANGTYTYDGLDLSSAFTGDEIDFEQALDTIGQIFQVTEGVGGFTTNLAPKMYISAKYDITDLISVGALYYSRFGEIKDNTAIAISGQAKIGEILTAGLTYSVFDKTYTNIGINATAKLGFFQVFATTDNIIGLAQQKEEQIAHFRVGMNFIVK